MFICVESTVEAWFTCLKFSQKEDVNKESVFNLCFLKKEDIKTGSKLLNQNAWNLLKMETLNIKMGLSIWLRHEPKIKRKKGVSMCFESLVETWIKMMGKVRLKMTMCVIYAESWMEMLGIS